MRQRGKLTMSIINDALKKTQNTMSPDGSPKGEPETSSRAIPESSPQLGDERFAKPPAGKNSEPATPPAGHRPKPPPSISPKPPLKNRKSKTPLWIGLVVVVFLALTTGLLKFFGQGPFAAKGRQTSSAPRQESPDGLQVSGIMTMGDKRVALINNEIYEVGDIVNGMRIVEIEKDKVHLSYGNQGIKTLKVFGN